MDAKKKIKFFTTGAAVLFAGILYSCQPEKTVVEETFSETETSTEATFDSGQEEISSIAGIYVYVCGEVQNPGVYELAPGSRICDALAAAGGTLKSAAEETMNLAATVSDGDKIYVPSEGETPQESIGSGTSQGGKVNINTADKEQLMTLPGIGEAKANAIISYRKEHGDFKDIQEIMNISGIKQAAFDNVKEFISVR